MVFYHKIYTDMVNKNIDMSKLRQILKFSIKHHLRTRVIHDITVVSRTTIQKYINKFFGLKIPWDELSTLSDKEVQTLSLLA